MKIIHLSRIENSEKYRVGIENGTELKVTAAQIADFGIYSGREFSEEEYFELLERLELGSAKARALRILGSRNLSSRELEKRLVQKGVNAEIAQETVYWLENIGVINDAEYASAIVKHYSGKGYGFARIKNELYSRGIPRELWEEALETHEDMEQAASTFLEKKLRGSNDEDSLRRAGDALYRRGFGRDEIKSAIDRYIESVEELKD